MCGHAGPVCRELSGLPGRVTKLRSLGVALFHGRCSRAAGVLWRGHIQLPRGLPGSVMSGRGERRGRNHRGQGDGSKKFLHRIFSRRDRCRPNFGAEADCSHFRYAAYGEMRTPMPLD